MKHIYVNGTILTMEDVQKQVEAICFENERIVGLGNRSDLIKRFPEAEIHDLCGKTMLPAFLDAHSHFTGVANALRLCDLSDARSFDDIIIKMKKFAKDRKLGKQDWLIGANYDHNFMKEKRHPDRHVLDEISMEQPIYISHASSHMGVANSAALQACGLHNAMKDPEGGRYGREADGSMNGYMEERAFVSFQNQVPMPSMETLLELMKEAQAIYASNGITTVQEGFTQSSLFQLLLSAAKSNTLYLDVVAYADVSEEKDLFTQYPTYVRYQNHLRLGGYKTFADGSPQGKTAWMLEPYCGSEDRGYPAMTDAQMYQRIEKSVRKKRQLLVHCNGDAAARQYITQFEKVMKQHPEATTHRPVMIHAQLVRKEELERMPALDMIPSFFVAHTWYWGDIHIENFGKQRADKISPAHTAKKLQLPYTFHNDSPVIPPNMLKTLWCAVNRKTKSGHQIGNTEALSVEDALRGLTIHVAHQYFEEDKKGSFKEGKQADFILLDKNPYQIDKTKLDKIQVLETWKEGKCIYQKK